MKKKNNVKECKRDKSLYLVYVGRERDGPYEVDDCLYDIQYGEDPYPDPEKVKI